MCVCARPTYHPEATIVPLKWAAMKKTWEADKHRAINDDHSTKANKKNKVLLIIIIIMNNNLLIIC